MDKNAIAEELQKTRKEIEHIKEKIRNKRAKMDDAKLGDYSSELPELKPKENMFQVRKALRGHLAKIYALQWADDSRQMVSASQDGKLLIWDAMSTAKLQVITLKSSWVMTCAYAPTEGQMVACGGLDSICTVYSLRDNAQAADRKPIRELNAHTGYISCCRFLDSNTIFTSSGDMTCMKWDIEKGIKVADYSEHNGDVMTISMSPTDRNIFATGSCDTTAKIWDIRTNSSVQTLSGHEGDINSVCFLSNGQGIATASDDATCKLFDLRADRELQTYQHDSFTSGATSVCFSKSGRIIFSSYEDFHCIAWNTITGEKLSSLPHTNRVSMVSVTNDGSALATSSWDAIIRIWA